MTKPLHNQPATDTLTPKLSTEEWLLAVILLVQVSLVCAGVLSRYLLNQSISYTEELTRYLLIWLACLGLPACWHRNEMIRFTWPGRRSPRWETWSRWISFATLVVFNSVLIYSSIMMIQIQWQYNQRTSVMEWPILWVSLALPFSASLVLLRAVLNEWHKKKR